MKRFVLLTTAAVLFGACDNGTDPVRVGEVEIRLNGGSVDEQAIQAGQTVQLTAAVFDEDGNQLTGSRVGWSSSVPSVATVSDQGLVTGVSTGETIVRATAGGLSDEVVIVVVSEPVMTINVNANDACTKPINRTARVKYISTHAIVVEDVTNPAGGFTDEEYKHFAVTFDTLVYPAITSNFGVPYDIDGNQRSIIIFTKAVNELTSSGSDSYVSGFFFSRDLFPKQATSTMGACPTSNEAEIFYMLVPDPAGEVNGNRRSKDFVAERTVGVLAHEFQHLINASRRLFEIKAGGTAWVEETWLNEGLSHIAEELIFYEATGLEPRQNIGIQPLRNNTATFDAFVEYQWSNFGRFVEYLQAPGSQSALGAGPDDHDLATRGAIWAFLRYVADRRGGSESTLWREMVDTDLVGLANLDARLNGQTFAWLRDWTVAVYSDDALTTIAAFQQPSWNFREILTSLRSAGTGSPLYPQYPLRVLELESGDANKRSLQLQGGSAHYLKFGVAPGTQAAVRASSGGLSSTGAVSCEPGTGGISLNVGEAFLTDASESPLLCIAGGATGSEYVLVPFNSAPGSSTLLAEIVASGTVKPIGPPNPSLIALSPQPMGLRVPPLQDDSNFHFDLRERERRELAPLVRGANTRVPSDASFSRVFSSDSVSQLKLTLIRTK